VPARLGSRQPLCGNIASRMFFPCHFSSQGCRPSIGCREKRKFWGVLTLRVFFLSFRAWSIHSYFGFVGDIVSQRLVSRGSPVLSCFIALAKRTFVYVSKSKLSFGLRILNSIFGHLLNILGVCSVGV